MILEFLWSVGVFVFIRCADPIFERYHNRAGVGGESACGFNCIGGDGRDSAPKKKARVQTRAVHSVRLHRRHASSRAGMRSVSSP